VNSSSDGIGRECAQVTETGVTEPGLQAAHPSHVALTCGENNGHRASGALSGHMDAKANARWRASRARPLASGDQVAVQVFKLVPVLSRHDKLAK
jgi:hypothetical protein